MSNIVPQPQITFENNKIYVDSPVDVKYTLDGLDPVFYGVIYTSPISISHTTTIKAISVNSLGEFSNLVAGTFTPESDVSDGSSGSTWNPSYDDAVTQEELSAMSYATTTYVADYVSTYGGGGGSVDLSSYVTYDYLESQSYVTEQALNNASYITINDVPTIDTSSYVTDTQLQSYLSSYVTYSFLNNQSYVTSTALENASYITNDDVAQMGYITNDDVAQMGYITSIPSEYVTQTELSSNSYVTEQVLSNASYATQSYVADYVETYAPTPDLSSYVTQTYLSSWSYLVSPFNVVPNAGYFKLNSECLGLLGTGIIYPFSISYTEFSSNSINSWASLGSIKNYVEGRIADIESTYATQSYVMDKIGAIPSPDLSAYVTETELSNCGYITSSDIPSIPVIDENIIPKETNTYTLGDADHLYYSAYISALKFNNYENQFYNAGQYTITCRINGANRYSFMAGAIRPDNSNVTLGTSSNQWAATYTQNLYADRSYIGDINYLYNTSNGGLIVNRNGSNICTFLGGANIGISPQSNKAASLGNPDLRWNKIYAYTAYLDGGTLTGRLESNYYTTVNSEGGISSYSSVLVGADDRNSVTMLATRRLCGETSYAAAFFTNSDGRSKFTHKTKTTATTALGSNDDAFLCFNAYGFKLAYSGTPGTSATTEYDVLHTGNSSYYTGLIHYGTCVHDRTSYTVTATVNDFATDSNGNPVVGTMIAVKLTSITGTNPATLYPVKFIVNGKELPRWYGNSAVTANGRNWYRDMNDGTNRTWYWMFDGTYWVWHGISDERDTTYSNMTDANMQAGTETTARLVTAKALATYYTAKSCFSFDSSTNTLTITTT